MRVLAVTPYFPPEGGGLERYAQAMLERMAAHGHEVHVVTCTREGDHVDAENGVPVERHHARWSIGNAPVDPSFTAHVRAAIQARRPDVVWGHAPVPFPAEMAARAAEQEDVPFVLTYHSGRLRGSTVLRDMIASVARLTTERRMMARARQAIAVSPFVQDNALRHHHHVSVVMPGVDPSRLFPAGEVDHEEVLFVAPLDTSYKWKGVDVLWDAYHEALDAVPTAKLRLVGAGDRLEEFRRKAEASPGHIDVAGRLDDDELVGAYRRAAVLVLPSTTNAEAFGMVLAEANACGRPVIGSRIGGIPDFIEHGVNGILTKPNDAGALARAMLRVLEDPKDGDRLGARGRERVLRRHDWDRLARRTEAVLERAAAEAAPVA